MTAYDLWTTWRWVNSRNSFFPLLFSSGKTHVLITSITRCRCFASSSPPRQGSEWAVYFKILYSRENVLKLSSFGMSANIFLMHPNRIYMNYAAFLRSFQSGSLPSNRTLSHGITWDFSTFTALLSLFWSGATCKFAFHRQTGVWTVDESSVRMGGLAEPVTHRVMTWKCGAAVGWIGTEERLLTGAGLWKIWWELQNFKGVTGQKWCRDP